jgi:hypothetical protein
MKPMFIAAAVAGAMCGSLSPAFAGGPPERLGDWLKSEIVKWATIADKASLAKR